MLLLVYLRKILLIALCLWQVQTAKCAPNSALYSEHYFFPPPTSYSTLYETACVSYTSPSGNYVWSQSGTYSDTIVNVAGGDSVMTIVLTVNMPDVTFIQEVSCGSFSWAMSGLVYSNSGNYAATTQNIYGCDSTVILGLTIVAPSADTMAVTECDTYQWAVNGVTYSSSGMYTEVFTDQFGCDSTFTLDLTILNASSSSLSEIACDAYTWSANGINYTSSGIYTETMINAQGCDSTVTLNLTILNSNTNVEYQTVCDQFTWIQNGETYTASGQYGDTLMNVIGCDSIIMLDLTVHNSNSSIDVIQSCGPYTWIDGVTYTSSTTSPTMMLTTVNGCDSLVQLDLHVGTNYNIVDSVVACSQYTWINGVTYFQSTNAPSWLYLTSIGCDSLITLHLEITQSSLNIDSIAVCDSFTWIDGVTYTASNYQATHTIINAQGCDSIVLLNLTILNPSSDVSIVGNSLVSEATNVIDYQWLDCGNNLTPVPNADSYIFAPPDNGFYAVQATNAFCTTISDCFSLTQVNLSEQTNDILSVYPVPTNDMLYIDVNMGIQKMEVYDMLGRALHAVADCDAGMLDVSSLAQGKYVVRVLLDDQTAVTADFVVN